MVHMALPAMLVREKRATLVREGMKGHACEGADEEATLSREGMKGHACAGMRGHPRLRGDEGPCRTLNYTHTHTHIHTRKHAHTRYAPQWVSR